MAMNHIRNEDNIVQLNVHLLGKMGLKSGLFNGILVDEMIDGTEIQAHWR